VTNFLQNVARRGASLQGRIGPGVSASNAMESEIRTEAATQETPVSSPPVIGAREAPNLAVAMAPRANAAVATFSEPLADLAAATRPPSGKERFELQPEYSTLVSAPQSSSLKRTERQASRLGGEVVSSPDERSVSIERATVLISPRSDVPAIAGDLRVQHRGSTTSPAFAVQAPKTTVVAEPFHRLQPEQAPVFALPQASDSRNAGRRNFREPNAIEPPSVQVRIGKVEIRASQPQQVQIVQAANPGGFSNLGLTRAHLSRNYS
jgi:hypothetical protein